ncbi:unnamed protein product [Linum trigynum]|uniref:Uncharacterized protein n=1 Tax=Linum trigynum TaxID=586398 RepID=A0AAV2GJE3_9ROSI
MDPFRIVTPNVYLTADDILDKIAIAVEGEDTDDSDNDADDTDDNSDDDGPVEELDKEEAVAVEPEGEAELVPGIEVHWISSDDDSDSDDYADSASGTPSLAAVLADLRDVYYSE